MICPWKLLAEQMHHHGRLGRMHIWMVDNGGGGGAPVGDKEVCENSMYF